MKQKLISTVLCISLLGMMTGCGSKTAGDSSSVELPILGTGIYSASDNFNSYIGKSIANTAKGIFKTNIEDGQNDQSTQNNQVDTMLAKGAKAVALSVVDVTAAPTIIDKAVAAGNVPVIFFNKEITDQKVMQSYDNVYFVGSTGVDYGATIQGKMIADALKKDPSLDKNGDGKLQIVYLMGDPGHTASQPRADYVKKAIKDGGYDYDLLAEDTGMWVTATAKDKMDAWISKYGDKIEFIITANDAMALGALTSIEAEGFNTKGKDSDKYIPVIGIDALPEMIAKIKSGEVMGSVLQDAKTQGQVVVKMAQNLTSGKDPVAGMTFKLDEAKAVRIPYKAITIENIAEAEATYATK